MTTVQVPGARVALSTASGSPAGSASASDLAERLASYGVEGLLWPAQGYPGAGARRAL